MKTAYNVTSGGRKKNTISFYRYNVPLSKPLKQFRKNVWEYLYKNFKIHATKVEDFMYAYLQRTPDKTKAIFTFDLPFVLRLIRKHFKNTFFVHCYLVQDFIYWFSKGGVKDNSFQKLKDYYQNEVYISYTKLTYDRLRARFEHEHKYNFDEYNKLKNIEIRNHFRFNNLRDFKKFYKTFTYLSNWGKKHNSDLSYSFDLLLNENTIHTPVLAFKMLKEIITSGNTIDYRPWLALQELSKSLKIFNQLLDLIQVSTFRSKHFWLLNWLSIVPKSNITSQHTELLIDVYRTIDQDCMIFFSSYEKYLAVDSKIFKKILMVIEQRNSKGDIRLTLDWHFFEQHLKTFSDDLPLIKRTYLQQQIISNHFDHDFKYFIEILKLDNKFLKEYLEFWSRDQHLSIRDHLGISIIWELDNAEDILWEAFDYLSNRNLYYLREDFCNAFFDKSDQENSERSIVFLKKYLAANKTNSTKVNTIFDCVRHSFRNRLEEFLLFLLDLNSDYELFKELVWTDNYFMGNGHTIWGDVRAAQYESVLEILNKIKKQRYKYSKHKELITTCILNSKKSADQERKRKFMHADW